MDAGGHASFRNWKIRNSESPINEQTYNTVLPLACPRVRMQMANKGNVVLYLDKELVEKSKELGFNLSKTFENHLKHLMTQLSTGNSINNLELTENKVKMVGQ
jgi:post-segregation antitoxin (ccd killing protein)